jgi:(p)ppGpp synthase/HD superfamily hydrolase
VGADVRVLEGAPLLNAFSDALDRALIVAARAHRDQVRKGGDVPYVQHPVHVAILLLKHGFDEAVVIAGVLHDVVEDTSVTLEDVRAQFGDRVAGLVGAVSETKRDASGQRLWRARKEEQLATLASAPLDVAGLKAADALHNVMTTLRDVKAHGDVAWRRFNAPKGDQLWIHRAIAESVRARLGDHPLARELEDAVTALERA